jgi:hypothetical protein
MVTIVELIDPRPYKNQPAVYGRLVYTVICMGDRLLNQANRNPICSPHQNCVVRSLTPVCTATVLVVRWGPPTSLLTVSSLCTCVRV